MDTRSLTLAAIGHSVNILPAEYSRCPVPVSLCWLASGFKHRVVLHLVLSIGWSIRTISQVLEQTDLPSSHVQWTQQ